MTALVLEAEPAAYLAELASAPHTFNHEGIAAPPTNATVSVNRPSTE
ncbi:hypothetical protein [Streptomyces noursei]|nr:hypothetical protein [Streptomyces noursei]